MAPTMAWKRTDTYRKNRIVMIRMEYDESDVELIVPTGLKKINSVDVSPSSAFEGEDLEYAPKYVTAIAIDGGTVTLTVTDPLEPCYLYVTAHGI